MSLIVEHTPHLMCTDLVRYRVTLADVLYQNMHILRFMREVHDGCRPADAHTSRLMRVIIGRYRLTYANVIFRMRIFYVVACRT